MLKTWQTSKRAHTDEQPRAPQSSLLKSATERLRVRLRTGVTNQATDASVRHTQSSLFRSATERLRVRRHMGVTKEGTGASAGAGDGNTGSNTGIGLERKWARRQAYAKCVLRCVELCRKRCLEKYARCYSDCVGLCLSVLLSCRRVFFNRVLFWAQRARSPYIVYTQLTRIRFMPPRSQQAQQNAPPSARHEHGVINRQRSAGVTRHHREAVRV